jgi:hypothetical protein
VCPDGDVKVAVHDAWHRADDERFERLAQALRELGGASPRA